MLSIKHITATIGTKPQFRLNDISFSLNKSTILAIVGKNGSGKSSLLNTIAGFIQAESGSISLNRTLLTSKHVHLAPKDRKIGYIFQSQNMIPHLSLHDNLTIGLSSQEIQKREKQIQSIISDLSLDHVIHKCADEASGGQQQLVALGRCLLHDKQLLLFDEAFSKLDRERIAALSPVIRSFIKKYKRSAIFVTHQISDALGIADKVGIIDKGRLLQLSSTQDIFQKPQSLAVASFLGPTNILVGTLDNKIATTQFGTVRLSNTTAIPSATKRLRILTRPDDYHIQKTKKKKYRVKALRYMGMHSMLTISTANCPRKYHYVLVPHEAPYVVGDYVDVAVSDAHTYMAYDIHGRLLT